jgi:FAD/FMN-containing dehydrogenase
MVMEYHSRGGEGGGGDDDDDNVDDAQRLWAERTFNQSAAVRAVVFDDATTTGSKKNSNSNTNSNTTTKTLALPRTIADVQECLQEARRTGRIVSVRTGGHNWFGASLRGDMVMDLRYFDDICIDASSQTAIVGPAVLGQTLNALAAPYGLCFPTGHCVGVPLGGYLLGGGFGWFQHLFGGMAAELILAMTIVTADGEVLTDLTDTTHPDWLWLARGAAAAFPAVVVSYTLQLQRLRPLLRHQTNLIRLDDYGSVVTTLCRMQLEGKLSRQVELSIIPACAPPYLVEPLRAALLHRQQQRQHHQSTTTTNQDHDEPVVIVPDKVCLFQVYVMADTEDEFADLVQPITDEIVDQGGYCLYRTDFVDATLSGLTDSVGPAYPPGLAWKVRSYQVETSNYATVDWSRLAMAFAEWDAAVGGTGSSKSHILTAIGPDGGYASGGGAYGTCLPGLVVAVYCATTAVVDDDNNNNARDGQVEQRPQHCHDELLRIVEEVLEPVATKYNPLEHPVHRDTFDRCYYPGSSADRIRQLRDRFDPDHLFYDPATIEPFV